MKKYGMIKSGWKIGEEVLLRKLLKLTMSMTGLKSSGSIRSLAAIITKGFCLGLLAFSCASHHVAVPDSDAQLSNQGQLPGNEVAVALLTAETQPLVASHSKQASFEGEYKSRNVQHVADWVVDSSDNSGMPFVIVDKMDAKVFVFYADGLLRGAAPVLLGLALGDDSVPGIGDRKLSDIRPEERTTPAGRFVASLGYNYKGKDVLWVDYNGAVSLHRVITTKTRLQRLATATPLDNRISYGCINVPEKFYNSIVSPTFTGTNGVVYVLPEVRSNSEIFASYYDVE